jgi:hypothetical protein
MTDAPPLQVAHWLDREADLAADKADKLREAARTIRTLWARLSSKPRSGPQHRRLFALINAAWKHWPETHEVQCGSPEGLRDYLQIKAGFGIPHKIVRGSTTYIWFEHKSIAYEKMAQDEFTKLADKIEAIIVDVVGVPADKLLVMDRNEV